jgi:hypothetical protein
VTNSELPAPELIISGFIPDRNSAFGEFRTPPQISMNRHDSYMKLSGIHIAIHAALLFKNKLEISYKK